MIERKTKAQWEIENPTLEPGDVGIEIQPEGYDKIKLGDGINVWAGLPYYDANFAKANQRLAQLAEMPAGVDDLLRFWQGEIISTPVFDFVFEILNAGLLAHIPMQLELASYGATQNISTSPAYPFAVTLPDLTLFLKKWRQGFYVGAINDAENHWIAELLTTVSGQDIVFASMTTVGLGSGAGAKQTDAFYSGSVDGANIRLVVRLRKVGNPSPLSVYGPSLLYSLA
jgi:hypothetical protein